MASFTNCHTCIHLDQSQRLCRGLDYGSPLRRCLGGLLREEVAKIDLPCNLLEVGCGTWNLTQQLCRERGVEWSGIDPAEIGADGSKTVATHIATVGKMPFADNHFDYVISSQTFEHWHEFGTPFWSGLAEIWRVLKDEGKLSLNFPLGYHGHPIFTRRAVRMIRKLFPNCYWYDYSISIRRKKPEPLDGYFGLLSENAILAKSITIGVVTVRKKKLNGSLTSYRYFLRLLRPGNILLVAPLVLLKAYVRLKMKGIVLHTVKNHK